MPYVVTIITSFSMLSAALVEGKKLKQPDAADLSVGEIWHQWGAMNFQGREVSIAWLLFGSLGNVVAV